MALLLSGCGARSSLKRPKTHIGQGGTTIELSDSGEGTGGTGGTGGEIATGGTGGGTGPASGGTTWVVAGGGAAGQQIGGTTAIGGVSGSGGLTGTGGSVGGAPGGATKTGGATQTGGLITGGGAGSGSGGATLAGGKTAIGGSTGTGGLTTATAGTGGRGGTGGGAGGAGGGGTGGSGAGGSARTGGTSGTGGSARTGGAGGTSGGTVGTGGGSAGMGGSARTGGAGGTGGSGGAGGSGGTGGSTSNGDLKPLAEVFCNSARICCSLAAYPREDLVDCESKFLSRLDNYALVQKGTAAVDQTALTACVSAYKAAATTCTMTAVESACKAVIVGTQIEGQACGGTSRFGAYECKPVNGSAACYRQNGGVDPTSVGICISIARGKSGDQCSMSCLKNERCIVDMLGGSAPFPVPCFEDDGLYCSVSGSPTVCKPILRIGDACAWDPHLCGTGNYCSWASTSNTCQVASKLGESCTSTSCAEGLDCDSRQKCVELPFASSSVCKGTPLVR